VHFSLILSFDRKRLYLWSLLLESDYYRGCYRIYRERLVRFFFVKCKKKEEFFWYYEARTTPQSGMNTLVVDTFRTPFSFNILRTKRAFIAYRRSWIDRRSEVVSCSAALPKRISTGHIEGRPSLSISAYSREAAHFRPSCACAYVCVY